MAFSPPTNPTDAPSACLQGTARLQRRWFPYCISSLAVFTQQNVEGKNNNKCLISRAALEWRYPGLHSTPTHHWLHWPLSHSCYLSPSQTGADLGDRVLHDEDVRHVSELSEVFPQFVLVGLPWEAAHEELPRRGVRVGGAATAGVALGAMGDVSGQLLHG